MAFFKQLLAIIYPHRCPYCRKVIPAGEYACDRCKAILNKKQRPITRGTMGFRCVSSFLYGGRVRRMLIRIKFYRQTQYISQAAVILAKDIRACYPEETFDLITYVPMHPKDQKRRGYNQSELLGKVLSDLLGIPSAAALNKIKRTKKQHTLSYRERRTNLKGAFALADRELVRQKRILLVDDIVTTGTTLGECCRKLNTAKPSLICCAAIADANAHTDRSALI